MALLFPMIVSLLLLPLASSSEATAGKITTPDATECPKVQQWTSSANYLCGADTGTGCELANYKTGLPLEVTFQDTNKTIHEPCNAFSTPFLIPATNQGATTSFNLGARCSSSNEKKSIFVAVRSPCYQNIKFRHGVATTDLVLDCGVPTGNQTMVVKIKTDFYKYGEVLGAHVRGVLNLHSGTCEFGDTKESLLVVSDGCSLNVWCQRCTILIFLMVTIGMMST